MNTCNQCGDQIPGDGTEEADFGELCRYCEDESWESDCLNCGVCVDCVERSQVYHEDMEAEHG